MCAAFKQIPVVPNQSEEIIGIKHSMVDECVSVKQSHSYGHKPDTGGSSPFALRCHNDAVSLILRILWDSSSSVIQSVI